VLLAGDASNVTPKSGLSREIRNSLVACEARVERRGGVGGGTAPTPPFDIGLRGEFAVCVCVCICVCVRVVVCERETELIAEQALH